MIREFSESDFPEILKIYNSSKLDELAFEDEEFVLLPLLEDKHRLNKLRESKIVVFDESGIKGYGAYLGNQIRSLYVDPNSRGRGIGRALLEHILEKIGVPALLHVTKSSYRVKSFYEQYGFRVCSEFEANYNGKSVLANEMSQGHDS